MGCKHGQLDCKVYTMIKDLNMNFFVKVLGNMLFHSFEEKPSK